MPREKKKSPMAAAHTTSGDVGVVREGATAVATWARRGKARRRWWHGRDEGRHEGRRDGIRKEDRCGPI